MNLFSASADDPAARRAFLGMAAGAAGLAGVSAFGAEAPPAAAPVFSVRDFGARGDGAADDTDAAQAAVDAAVKARGGRVHFPSGAYRLTRTITVASSDRMDLTGDGFSSVLLHAGPEHCLAWKEGCACRESSVRDLCIVAAGQSKAPGTAAIACLGGAERSLFSHLLLTGGDIRMGSGILTRGVADTTALIQCVMWGVTGTGLEVARGSEVRLLGGRIIGFTRDEHPSVGVAITGNNGGVHILTTDIIGLGTAVKIGGGPGAPSNREIFITHATVDGCTHGIHQTDNAYTSIAGCWAASCDEEQILVEGKGAVLAVAGGTIFNGGAHGKPGAHHGMVVRGGSFTLSGLTIRHNQGTGLLVEGDVRDYAVTGCRIADNGRGAVLGGDNFVFASNTLARNGVQIEDNGGSNKNISGNILTDR